MTGDLPHRGLDRLKRWLETLPGPHPQAAAGDHVPGGERDPRRFAAIRVLARPGL